MATSTMSDHQSLPEQDHHHHPIRRSSGRRKAKGGGGGGDSKKNKQPRRGMGMAKLEQLRQQETQPPAFPPFAPTRNPPLASDYRLLHNHFFPNHDSDFLASNFAKCYSLHCNACHKKKRVNNIGVDLGLNIGDNQNVVLNEESLGVGNHGNKVLAVHRKGSCSIWEGGNGGVMMEYDFFPKQAKSGSMDSEAVRSVGGSSSMDVDLSLKLSY